MLMKQVNLKKGKWITKRDWRIMGRLTIAQPKNSCSKFIFNSHTENSNASMPLRFHYEWFSNNSLVKLIITLMTSFVAILKTLISNTDCVIYILNKGDFFVTFSRIYTEIAAELWFCGLHWKFNFGETKQFLSVSYFQGIRIVQIVGCIYYVGHSMLSWRRILPRLDSK